MILFLKPIQRGSGLIMERECLNFLCSKENIVVTFSLLSVTLLLNRVQGEFTGIHSLNDFRIHSPTKCENTLYCSLRYSMQPISTTTTTWTLHPEDSFLLVTYSIISKRRSPTLASDLRVAGGKLESSPMKAWCRRVPPVTPRLKLNVFNIN